MPTRMIREGILDSEAVNALSEEAELFYRRLMSVVDDFGRFEDKLALIRARCFPLRLEAWPLERVERCLDEISQPPTFDRTSPSNDRNLPSNDRKPPSNDGQNLPLVTRYEVDGRKCLQINNFGQRERTSKHPPPPNDGKPPSNDRNLPSNDRTLPPKAESEARAESEANTNTQQQQAAAGPAAAAGEDVLSAVQLFFPTAKPGEKWARELAGVQPSEHAAVAERIRRRPAKTAQTPVILVREAVAEVRSARSAPGPGAPPADPRQTLELVGEAARAGEPWAIEIVRACAEDADPEVRAAAEALLRESAA